MAARVRRLAHPDVHVQTPHSRTTHLVSNLEVDLDASGPVAHASFVMAEHRGGVSRWYAGRYLYRLRREVSGLRIALKKVVLVDCDASFTAMAVYL
jgi:3-phenylpropionate/cinnamic acid dioxygenase small subunit